MKQRVVVTGTSGFIGSLLVKKLVPDFGVVTLQNVLTDTETAEKIIREGDILIHLACSTFPAISEQNRARDAEVNIVGTVKLLEVCKRKEVGKIVFLSSGGTVYGNGAKSHKETDALSPKSSYGVIKATLESYIQICGLRQTILRPSNIYGRRNIGENQMLGAVDIFLHRIMNEEPIRIWGDGNNVRDYLYVDDLLDFIALSLQDQVEGVYNVGTGIGTSLNQIVRTIEEMSGKKANVEYLPARETDVRSNILDASKAKQIGWVAKYSLEKGVQDMLRRFF